MSKEIAEAFAAQFDGSELEWDAVLIDATRQAGKLTGRIYFDRKSRFSEGCPITTSRVVLFDGSIHETATGTRYLVQMRAAITSPAAAPEIVRVLRVIEYVGPRADVEAQVACSLHGERKGRGGCIIKAATIGTYPEILA